MKIGVLKETKVPADFRVPFTPAQLVTLQQEYGIECVIQPSENRCYKNSEYMDAGIKLQDDLLDCDILFGVKEVPIKNLIPSKAYVFFSHTIKEQVHNQSLMHALIEKNITMIDYETLTDDSGKRVVAFGREAGIVGAYNAIKVYGEKSNKFKLPQAHTLDDMEHLFEIVSNVPHLNIRVVNTGRGGRVSSGSVEVFEKVGLKSVSPQEYLNGTGTGVYTVLAPKDYIKRTDGSEIVESDFFADPSDFESAFLQYAGISDMYVSGHFWDSRSSVFFEMKDIKDKDTFAISIISDVSCDLASGDAPMPIPTTLRETKLDNIAFDVCRKSGMEKPAFENGDNITITAVDNLPSSIPRDASHAFGTALLTYVMPFIINGDDGRIHRATICFEGKLGERYKYLKEYAGL